MVLKKINNDTFSGLEENVTDEVRAQYATLETNEDKIVFIEKILGLKE